MVWLGVAQCGVAWIGRHGVMRQSQVRQGTAGLDGRGMARRGEATNGRHGQARIGAAWQGVARIGMAGMEQSHQPEEAEMTEKADVTSVLFTGVEAIRSSRGLLEVTLRWVDQLSQGDRERLEAEIATERDELAKIRSLVHGST